jgi:lipopolysaccharide biosynthesis protein
MRLLAFYLPQFYPTEFNDNHWGKGFTEWTNVTRAKPQFEGHFQPRLPAGMGFYDLRIQDNYRAQVVNAVAYGISGFVFYYYRFNGRRELGLPLNTAYELGHPDADGFPYCICWANENWTRSWDGLNNNILLQQNHNDADDLEFIKSAGEMMSKRRYIKVDGKPLLLIYRTELWQDMKKTATVWREYMKATYGMDIYLVRCDGFKTNVNPADIGFDAAYQFPPLNFSNGSEAQNKVNLNKDFKGGIPDYNNWPKFVQKQGYKTFRGVMPSWDNTPRKMERAHIFHGANPDSYKEWLKAAIEFTKNNFEGDEQLVFINAWNEWAEGAILEPCSQWGYSYLQKTREALNESR